MVQSMPEASPAKWHQAHTTWFFETFVLTPHAFGYRPFNPAYPWLFNSYYKQVGPHPLRTLRHTFSRPTLPEVRDYRAYVDRHLLKLLAGAPAPSLAALVELGLNHEQQRQELILTDMKHAFWTNPLRPSYQPRARANGPHRLPAAADSLPGRRANPYREQLQVHSGNDSFPSRRRRVQPGTVVPRRAPLVRAESRGSPILRTPVPL
jgi:hypothetical protein